MKVFIRKTFSIAILAFLISLPALAATSCMQRAEKATKLGVAVTILPQAEFVEQVGGDRVSVTVMVSPGASPHTYEPTPGQMEELSRAEMYAKVGSAVEFELSWMDDFISTNKDMLVVDCSQGIQIQEMGDEHTNEEDDENNESEKHWHGDIDPHIWMSPQNAQIMVNNIADGLMQVDPDNRDYYEQNRDAYLEELVQLDHEITKGLSGVTNRIFMVYHPAFGYFASNYNLDMLTIEDEGKEPTPSGLAHLIEQARRHDIRVIFASPQFNPDSAEVIADEIDGKVIFVDPLARDYCDNISEICDYLIQYME